MLNTSTYLRSNSIAIFATKIISNTQWWSHKQIIQRKVNHLSSLILENFRIQYLGLQIILLMLENIQLQLLDLLSTMLTQIHQKIILVHFKVNSKL